MVIYVYFFLFSRLVQNILFSSVMFTLLISCILFTVVQSSVVHSLFLLDCPIPIVVKSDALWSLVFPHFHIPSPPHILTSTQTLLHTGHYRPPPSVSWLSPAIVRFSTLALPNPVNSSQLYTRRCSIEGTLLCDLCLLWYGKPSSRMPTCWLMSGPLQDDQWFPSGDIFLFPDELTPPSPITKHGATIYLCFHLSNR